MMKIENIRNRYKKLKKDLANSEVSPNWWEKGRNREFYATARFAYLRVVKRLKMVQKMNWLMGLEIDLI